MTSSVNWPGSTHVPGLSFTWATASVVSVYQFCSSKSVWIDGLVHLAVNGTWWAVDVALEGQRLHTCEGRMIADSWSPTFFQTINVKRERSMFRQYATYRVWGPSKQWLCRLAVQPRYFLKSVRAKWVLTLKDWLNNQSTLLVFKTHQGSQQTIIGKRTYTRH